MGKPDKSVKRPKKKGDPKPDVVRCSGCDTFLGFADDIMYPIGTTEGMCHWCEEKVRKRMTEPKLELDHIFDSEKVEPDDRITIDINKKLILTHGLTAFDMPMIHRYTVKYFKLLEYPAEEFPILQFTKDHYQMKNGWKITLEHWWIPNVPLSERYYAHNIYVPRSKKEEHNDWTNGDWKINLLKFDYLSNDYEMQAWIHRLPEIGIPFQDVPVKKAEYFRDVPIRARVVIPPGGKFPNKEENEPKNMVEFAPPEPETNICPLCNDIIPDDTLRSPNFLCEKCKRPIACPSCKEEVLEPVGITECPWCHTDTKSTEKIKHAIRVRQEKKTYEEEQTERYKFMTEYATEPVVPTDPIGPKPWDPTYDEYPHRDDDDLMKPKKGWGVPFDIEKPTVASIAKEQEKIADIMLNEIDDEIEQIKEEAQRGTGRSTQRRLSALNHLIDRVTGFVYEKRKVLFIVDTQKDVKATRRAFEELRLRNPTDKYIINSGFMDRIDIRTLHDYNDYTVRGRRGYTLIVIDLIAPMPKEEIKRFKMNISTHMCPIIGGESIVETGEEEKPDPDPTKYNVTEHEFQPKILVEGKEYPVTDVKYTVNQDVQPVYAMGERRAVVHNRGPTTVEGTFKGVMQLPKPRHMPAMDYFAERKGGAIPTTAKPKRIPSRKGNPPKRARHPFGGVSALPKKREWAKPSQSLTTTIGGSWDWGWILMRMAVAIFFIVILLAMLSWAVK